jgi:hypothetical protein
MEARTQDLCSGFFILARVIFASEKTGKRPWASIDTAFLKKRFCVHEFQRCGFSRIRNPKTGFVARVLRVAKPDEPDSQI